MLLQIRFFPKISLVFEFKRINICIHLHPAVLIVEACLVPSDSWINDSLYYLHTVQLISVNVSCIWLVNEFSRKCFGIRGAVGSCSSSLPVLFPESFPLEHPDFCQRAPVWCRLPLGNISPSWLLTHTNRGKKRQLGRIEKYCSSFPSPPWRKGSKENKKKWVLSIRRSVHYCQPTNLLAPIPCVSALSLGRFFSSLHKFCEEEMNFLLAFWFAKLCYIYELWLQT